MGRIFNRRNLTPEERRAEQALKQALEELAQAAWRHPVNSPEFQGFLAKVGRAQRDMWIAYANNGAWERGEK